MNKELYFIVIRFHLALEFCILLYFFQNNFKNKLARKAFLVIAPIFLVYSIYDYFVSPKLKFGANQAIVESFFMLIILIYFFYEKIKYEVQIPLYESKPFWIAVALFIFFSGNFFLLIYSKTMINDLNFRAQYVFIYSSFNIFKNLLLCVALFIKETNIPLTPNNNPFDMLDENPYPFNKQN
ncbi:hypothetical protein [Ferruginibacter profundus]